ncbi:MAG TPA: non-ribosomal peptide synthetase [Anaerolineales bacterium]
MARQSEVNEAHAYQGIYTRLAKVVAAHPEAVAVEAPTRRLTYAELDELSGGIASRLHNLVGEDSRPIALWLADPADLVAAIFGAIRGARPFSIISRRNPPERRRAMIDDLKPAAVLASDSLMQDARAAGVEADRLVSIEALRYGGKGIYIPVEPQALAAIYYTSGSTGEPKGVMRSHALIEERGLLETVRNRIQPGDRVVMCYSLSAAASLSSLSGTLFGGGTLHVYEAESQGVSALTNIVSAPGTTILRIPVELLRGWLATLHRDAFFGSLRVVSSAGDIVFKADLEALRPHVRPEMTFSTHYAMSEFGLLTRNDFHIAQLPTDDIVPVGLPRPDRQLLIVNELGKEAATGEVGEICIRAYEHKAGYWNRPELNSAMLMPDPLDAARSIYRTGDLGRLKPDGELVLAGRKDQRVKIRGFTVDMSSVEAVLMRSEGVQRAVVVARQHPAGERRLVAYVVPADGHTLEPGRLRHALSGHLPDYMLPSLFVTVPAMPLTRTGKVDKQALPQPPWDQPQRTATFVEPRDEIESRLVQIWQRHLRTEQIGIDDEFFDLGGDSLMAVSLMATVEQEFSRPLLVTTMIKAPTIRQQADILRNAALEDADPVMIPVRTTGKREPVFCLGGKGGTPIRFRALLSKIDPDRPVYYFRSRGLRQGERTIDHVEEIAAQYLAEVKRIQPHGPYFFLGESGGGIVAYEMAQQLIRQGAGVGFLGLLDTYLPKYRNIRPPMGTLVRKHLQTITSGGSQGLRVYVGYYVGLAAYKLRRAWSRLRLRWISTVRSGAMARHARVELANIRASRSYTPQPYPHSVHLFHAVRQALYEGNVRANGWADVGIGDLVVHPLDCYHGNVLFEPFVSEVARVMNQLLQ